MSAHLRGQYQKAHRSLVSVILRQLLLIIQYWYRLVSPPILVSATITSRYQYWIQGVTIDHISSSVSLFFNLFFMYLLKQIRCRDASQQHWTVGRAHQLLQEQPNRFPDRRTRLCGPGQS
jgi:hypothetical protein